MNTLGTLPPHILRSIEVDASGGCWLWTRSQSRDGYGWSSLNNKTHQAHRLIYRLLVGEPPEGTVLDHLCRVRHCVNPDHLEPVTPRENQERSSITNAGANRCLRCGEQFAVVGKTRPQRRCKSCQREWRRQYARDYRRGQRRRQPGVSITAVHDL